MKTKNFPNWLRLVAVFVLISPSLAGPVQAASPRPDAGATDARSAADSRAAPSSVAIQTGDVCDGCPDDPNKTAPGMCGCGVPDTDTDGDGTPDCNDACPNDATKTQPGICGCGVADTDTDGDGMPDCNDLCPSDPNKTEPGICGCGVPDTDTDSDGVPDCVDQCPLDLQKAAPGVCGCGVADTDTDHDGTADCHDACPNDPNKTQPGMCGCGVADTDTDHDGTADCHDACPNDANKTQAGACGCGVPDTDTDGDGVPDCHDACPNDATKTQPGICGCGVADTDTDGDGVADCIDLCQGDPYKIEPGVCGCGVADTDSDSDGTPDCVDLCPIDPAKTAPGACGCGAVDILTDSDNDGVPDCVDQCPGHPDTDTDGDGYADCVDECITDPNKHLAGTCGCFVSDVDSDGDGTPDCLDSCPLNPERWNNYGKCIYSQVGCSFSDLVCTYPTGEKKFCLGYCFNDPIQYPRVCEPCPGSTQSLVTIHVTGTGSGRVFGPGLQCSQGQCQTYVETYRGFLLHAEWITGTFTGWGGDCSGQRFECLLYAPPEGVEVWANFDAPGSSSPSSDASNSAFVQDSFSPAESAAGSGIKAFACPARADTLAPEGEQSGTVATSAALAGGSGDQTAPVPSVDSTPCLPTSSTSAAFTFSATDPAMGGTPSGVDRFECSLDGAAFAACTSPASYAGLSVGDHTFAVKAIDNAGNVSVPVNYGWTIAADATAPAANPTQSPAANGAGWNNSDVTATWNWADEAGGSGIDPANCTATNTSSGEGAMTLSATCKDRAGNTGSATFSVNVDKTRPTITGSRSLDANANGWNNTAVAVSFSCADNNGSGVAGCAGDTVLENEGANQQTVGQALDNAGNQASATVSGINIDRTAPNLTGAPTTAANSADWYNSDVTIHWTAQDGLSQIDEATRPADSLITGEGRDRSATATVKDKAGNSKAATVSVKIDRTAPTLSGQVVNDDGTPRSPADGWFNSAVRVRFNAADLNLADGTLGSGVASTPADVLLDQDGASQTATSATGATDMAGNVSSPASVSGISIDSQAPQTSTSLQCTGKNGWCRGNKATVVLTAADQPGLAGVKEIRYSTNGNTWKTATGASVSVDLTLNGSGKATVLFYAVDNAGNQELQGGVDVKYDTIAPTVTHNVSPAPNAAGWNKADVKATFTAQDDADGSGVETLSIDGVVVASQTANTSQTLSGDKTIGTETAGQTVNAQAEDFAGNLGSDSAMVKLDKTAPTISGAATSSPNANNWYKGPVTVHFTCSDAGTVQSGIATCQPDVTLTANGAGQSASGTAEDNAGNTASTTVGGINIDTIPPVVTIGGVADGAIYTQGSAPAPTCSATDEPSGLDGACSGTLTGGTANGVGSYTYTATASDKAGNNTTVSVSYRVTYRWDGFLQPINDTAHQVGQSVSIFKAGSTVPTKFQLKDANGNVVQASTLPLWLTPAKGGPTTVPIDEEIYGDPATDGTRYRWDAASQQYIFNWKSGKNDGGYYWRIGVELDDGQIYYVNIGLR